MRMRCFRPLAQRRTRLLQKEHEAILNIDPAFLSVEEVVYFDNYDLPCPILVSLRTRQGSLVKVVLRRTRHGDVRNEVPILRALKAYGLPVPQVLAGPFKNDRNEHVAVYSLLPGENLQKLSMGSGRDLDLAKNLLIQATTTLTDTGEFIKKYEAGGLAPSKTLADELRTLCDGDNPWYAEKVFSDAIRKLQGSLDGVATPLVFTNGDYQPGNFLAQAGELTGFLDFESPSFQDPMMAFVKYPIYDLQPISRTDLIQVFLRRHGFSEEEFGRRLVLGCLQVLKKEVPVLGGDIEMQKYRERVLSILNKLTK
jgi:hypothetical protein